MLRELDYVSHLVCFHFGVRCFCVSILRLHPDLCVCVCVSVSVGVCIHPVRPALRYTGAIAKSSQIPFASSDWFLLHSSVEDDLRRSRRKRGRRKRKRGGGHGKDYVTLGVFTVKNRTRYLTATGLSLRKPEHH